MIIGCCTGDESLYCSVCDVSHYDFRNCISCSMQFGGFQLPVSAKEIHFKRFDHHFGGYYGISNHCSFDYGYVLRNLFYKVVIVTYTVPLAEVVSIFTNTCIDFLWLRLIGVTSGVLGVGVFAVSVFTMRDNWRAGIPQNEKTKLVTSGIYSYSRNPAFLGFDLVYIGVLSMFFNWGLFIITLVAVIMLHLQIVNVEEKFLMAAFGNDYLAYRKKYADI